MGEADDRAVRRIGRHLGCAAFFHFGLVVGMADGIAGKAHLASAIAFAAFPTAWPLGAALFVLLTQHFRWARFFAPSHFLLWLCLGAHLAWSVTRAASKLGGRPERAARATSAMLLTARVAVVTTYAFAFVHKCNTAFVHGATSPINNVFVDQLGHTLPALVPVFIALTLMTEGSLPFLLSFRRSRPWGVALALAFHFGLGLFGFYSFSAVMFALLLAQGPIPLPPGVTNPVQRILRRATPLFERTRLLVLPAGGVLLFALAVTHPVRSSTEFRPFWVALWLVYGVATVVTWNGGRDVGGASDAPAPRASLGPFAALPAGLFAILIFFGFGPYLGYSNAHTFDMYSGLTAVGFRTNHLFVPGSLQSSFFQGRLVRVVGSNVPELKRLRSRKAFVPYTFIQEIVEWMPPSRREQCKVRLEEWNETPETPERIERHSARERGEGSGEIRETRCGDLLGGSGSATRFLPPLIFQFKPKPPLESP